MTLPADPLDLLADCRLCPRACGVNRLKGEVGFCGIGRRAVVASSGPHFGEEPPLVGTGGSGAVFFAGCNLACSFCQNHDISQGRQGRPVSEQELARIMLSLQAQGCIYINLVTPTHVLPQILAARRIARDGGLRLRIVYNTGGYDDAAVLREIEGQVDIYMPDFKYDSSLHAGACSGAWDYPEAAKRAVTEMHRQVGDLEIVDGIAVRGLLVRHLVMPGLTDDGKRVMSFLATRISRRSYVNVMGQYRPCYRAERRPEINRRPTPEEVESIRAHARGLGLRLARE